LKINDHVVGDLDNEVLFPLRDAALRVIREIGVDTGVFVLPKTL
jgi:hypothetical protein